MGRPCNIDLTKLSELQDRALKIITDLKYKKLGCPRYIIHEHTIKSLIFKGIIRKGSHPPFRLFVTEKARYSVKKLMKKQEAS